MALHFHKKAVSASSATLATLLKKYESYGKKIEYPEDDEERHDKCSSNMVLLVSCLSQIKTGIDSLQSKIDKMELQYANAKSKTEQKELLLEIEDFEKESKYSETLQEAEGFQYVVEANIADTKIKLRKVQLKLKLPVQSDINEESTSTSGESNRSINPAREVEEIPEENRNTRSAKPPIIKLPKFYGNQEEFPEYWALYESLIHKSNELTTIEKIVLLKESIRGPAETAIRGIKPIPSNYEWMIDTLKKRFSNQPTNRSKIVQKLFDLPHAGKKADSCQRCYDSITTLVHQMVSAGYDIRRTCDPMWTETIIKKFPYEIVKDVLVKNQEVDSVTIQELLDILEKEISAKAYVELRLGFERSSYQGNLRQEGVTRNAEHCVFCNRSNHISVACRTIPDQGRRKEILKQKNLCWKCFAQDHPSNLCRKPNCSHCGRTHHSSLCTAAGNPTSGPVDANQPRPSRWNRNEANQRHLSNRHLPGPHGRQHVTTSNNNRPAHSQFNTGQRFSSGTERPTNNTQLVENEHTTISRFPVQEQLILMTAEGNIYNHVSQQYERVLFFFDTGAQKTVIEEELANKFGLPRITTETCVMSGMGGHTEKFESHSVRMNITTAFGAELEMIVQTKPIITGGFPAVKLSKEDQEFLQMKELCVANSKLRGERLIPRILVGLDRYYDLVVADTTALRTPSGLHVAKTVFGPTIYGRGMIDNSQNNLSITHNYTSIEQPTEVAMLEKMFELDGLGIFTNELQKDDSVQKYFEQYKKSISFENGYVTAPFPLKDNIVDLGDNYSVSIKRLSALQRQLSDNKEQCAWYSKILADYENLGIIERVHAPEACAVGKYYMPHSGVWRPHEKVPLRIVFDASSKRRGQLSLNDAIYKGESFVNKIQDILVASRTSNIIMLCDIEAAFTQIRLPQEHKDLCQFLWLENSNLPPTKNNVIEYRFTRLAFGITAAPSILNMCIAAYLSTMNTDLAHEIADNIYVDNILLQADTPEEALQKYRNSKALFAKIGMNLREYVSNSDLVNKQIPEQDRVPTGLMKYLGMEYDTMTDRFTVTTHFPMKAELKKRDIVSQLNSIYDPLGLAGPLLIELKSMMRDILHAYSDWNDRLAPDVCQKWNKKCSEVNNAVIAVSRPLLGPVRYSQIATRLWVFADASKAAIAACAYIQAQESNEVSQLVTGKTRLAPKKNVQTIPRLELLGILIAMRLAATTTAAVSTIVKEVHVVTDSEVALCWIKSTRKLPVFVSNQCVRIQNIKSELEKLNVSVHFHHVPTSYNPADAGTRGLSKEQIVNHDWVHGPRWLCQWPNIAFLRPIEIVQAAEPACDHAEPSTSLLTVKSTSPTLQPVFDLTRLSRLSTALRVVARVGKFLHRIIAKANEKRSFPIQLNHIFKFNLQLEINADDIKAAETILYADIHRNIDTDELSKKFRQMHIIRDKDGVIRHISRLQHAPIPLDTKSPILLPNRGELTRLVLTDIHYRNFHCGKDQTLSLARQRYWIPRASGSFKYYLKNCAVCKRWQGLPFGSPNMPPLPSDRVVITKPFSNVGCDFIGPLSSKTGENMYICLYTCLVTRAVHLEAVENMTAGAFLNSFIRFVSRRGVPHLIRSDCGANFRLGSKIIEELSKPDESTAGSVMSYSADNGIKWVFNPPASPWMGGVWERLVGSVKRCMRKSVGRKKLTFTELSTVVAAIEAVINTRPLTKLSSTDLSEIPLRPVDFIQRHVKFSLQDAAELGGSDDPSYEPNFVQTRKQAIEAFTTSEKIATKFWEKWCTEYLTTLRESQKLHLKQSRHVARTAPEKGEIVLIEQDLLPRGCWSYGKIVEVISSNDGLIRTAKVLTPSGIVLIRPINKLYPLEIRSPPDESSEESITDAPPIVEEVPTRPVLPRSSKTRAYDVIRDFENSLEDTHISHMSVVERSNKGLRSHLRSAHSAQE